MQPNILFQQIDWLQYPGIYLLDHLSWMHIVLEKTSVFGLFQLETRKDWVFGFSRLDTGLGAPLGIQHTSKSLTFKIPPIFQVGFA